jgi:hypothetical protein
MKEQGHVLIAIAMSHELRDKIQKIADAVDAKNQNRLFDYIRKVLSNHIVDVDIKGDIDL